MSIADELREKCRRVFGERRVLMDVRVEPLVQLLARAIADQALRQSLT